MRATGRYLAAMAASWRVALVVGMALCLIHHWPYLLELRFAEIPWGAASLNFVVPMLVSAHGRVNRVV